MYIIDNTTRNNHYAEIKKLASISDEIVIVSPFCFGDFKYFFDKIVAHNNIQSITLITTLRNEEVMNKIPSLQSFQNESKKLNINHKLFINNRLHGKVYLFKNRNTNQNAIITSANITHNGLGLNHEWGCCLSNTSVIDNLEQNINNTIQYQLTADIIQDISLKLDEYNKEHPKQTKDKPLININDIVIPHIFKVGLDSDTRIFIKPIGSTDEPIYDGDYSKEKEQYFSKKRPKAVRNGDYLISYGVGSRKIISIFKVISKAPIYSGNDDERWPWYVEVDNVTPKLGSRWFNKNLYIMDIANEYVEMFGLNLTNNGGDTLGALQWGVDKIQLDHNFGTHLMELILNIEDKI